MKNIIFIEGVTGVGKSTTVNKLGDELRNRGYTVRCHNEGDPDNPLHLCWAAYLEIREYEHLLLKYPLFVKELSENIIYRGEYILAHTLRMLSAGVKVCVEIGVMALDNT